MCVLTFVLSIFSLESKEDMEKKLESYWSFIFYRLISLEVIILAFGLILFAANMIFVKSNGIKYILKMTLMDILILTSISVIVTFIAFH